MVKFKPGDYIMGIDRSFLRSLYQVVRYHKPSNMYITECIMYDNAHSLGIFPMKREDAEKEYEIVDPPKVIKVLYGKA